MSIFLYGAGDDLIELEGDLYDEFQLPSDDTALVAFDNGLLVRIVYNGEWVIRVLKDEGIDWMVHPANSRQAKTLADNDYSDVLELRSPAKWAVLGSDYVVRK